MWQITFFDNGKLQVVNSPNYRAIEALYFNLPQRCRARLWSIRTKGQPRLIC